MLRCSKCRGMFPEDLFFRNKANRTGHQSQCKSCFRETQVQYEIAHPQHSRDRLLGKYGLALESYAKLLDAQGGVCAVCCRPQGGSRHKNLAVDHNHETGRVRGLLCDRCNRALGLLRDSEDVIQSLLHYLQATKVEETISVNS